MKKRFEVKILGQELSVTSDSGDEHVANVVKFVSGKVEEAGKAAGSRNALNIADEYLQIIGAKENIHNQLENKAEQLISMINDCK